MLKKVQCPKYLTVMRSTVLNEWDSNQRIDCTDSRSLCIPSVRMGTWSNYLCLPL